MEVWDNKEVNRHEIYERIDIARDKADTKFGERTLPSIAVREPDRALTVLAEEVGEVARAIIDGDSTGLVGELIDVLQVGTAWLEAL